MFDPLSEAVPQLANERTYLKIVDSISYKMAKKKKGSKKTTASPKKSCGVGPSLRTAVSDIIENAAEVQITVRKPADWKINSDLIDQKLNPINPFTVSDPQERSKLLPPDNQWNPKLPVMTGEEEDESDHSDHEERRYLQQQRKKSKEGQANRTPSPQTNSQEKRLSVPMLSTSNLVGSTVSSAEGVSTTTTALPTEAQSKATAVSKETDGATGMEESVNVPAIQIHPSSPVAVKYDVMDNESAEKSPTQRKRLQKKDSISSRNGSPKKRGNYSNKSLVSPRGIMEAFDHFAETKKEFAKEGEGMLAETRKLNNGNASSMADVSNVNGNGRCFTGCAEGINVIRRTLGL